MDPSSDDPARSAWISLLRAHVRSAQKHAAAAKVHAQTGHVERRMAELDRLSLERAEFDAAVARHPEWADDVPAWPKRAEQVDG
jgi:predicted RNA-binding protein YlxR (DUF448 family)